MQRRAEEEQRAIAQQVVQSDLKTRERARFETRGDHHAARRDESTKLSLLQQVSPA